MSPAMADDEPPTKKAKSGDGPQSEKVSFDLLEGRLKETIILSTPPADGSKFIATHHGTFHADEAMACAMLKCLPEFASLPIVRTRNAADIDKASVVVDVGGTYEPEKNRYDHHQKTFEDTYSKDYPEIKLSSAGLVYKHFGPKVVEMLCGTLEPRSAAAILAKTYDSLIRELDALDNGVSVAEAPRYRFVTNLGARIGRLNPSWREVSSPELENARFREATILAAKELTDIVHGYCNGWLPAREIVEKALSARKEIHASGEIMKLPSFCPWQEHMFDLEAEEEDHRSPLVKYVLFQDSRGGWRVQAAPSERGSFSNRKPLPKPWRGLRDSELSQLSGISDCVFVHAGGFIGGNATEAGAHEMAVKALEHDEMAAKAGS